MKDKKLKILLVFFVIFILIGFRYCASNVNKTVDWNETYTNKDKIPYGTFILYDLLGDVFEKDRIYPVRHTIYNEFNDAYVYDDEDYLSTPSISYSDEEDISSYVFINKSFTASKDEIELLLDFVSGGNNLFISAEQIAPLLLDTLHIKVDYEYVKQDAAKYRLTDMPKRVYNMTGGYSFAMKPDSLCKLDVRVLGYVEDKTMPNFVQISYGDGYIYLHTTPKAFSNYELLKLNQYDYAFRCLSYLPQDSYVIWDEYQKQGAPGEQSMFRVIWADKNLRIAFLIVIGGTLLFMIFRSKRIQRMIPIINPPRNSSIEFLETLSNLYRKQEDYQTIANKRMAFLLDQIRRKYYLSTEVLDDEFSENLSLKSGVELDVVKDLFLKYKAVRDDMGHISNQKFLLYTEALETFYKKSNIRK